MSDTPASTTPGPLTAAVRRWFAPPRAHGEIIEDRVVSFLELFYDLVFVVLIASISHTLAADVSWAGVRDFVIVFALIWLAWANGSTYHEMHGREDGSSRSAMFAQMMVLVLLSVYSGHAADTDGRNFALVFAVFLVLVGLQWAKLAPISGDEYRPIVYRYVAGLGFTTLVVLASAAVDDPEIRVWMWGGAVLVDMGVMLFQTTRYSEVVDAAFVVTESMSERFGLFTIIVLGEVVVGVSDGLSEADRGVRTIATGLVALTIGFGFWWNYFDFLGRRVPRQRAPQRSSWIFGHLPMSMSIAAAGAGMVTLIEHAQDARTPVATAWLIAASTAGIALSLALLCSTMPPRVGTAAVQRNLVIVAVWALLLGVLRPTPLVMAIGLSVGFSAVWLESFVRHARNGELIVE